ILVGSLFSFMTSLQEASAVLFLALGGWESMTNGIFAFYIAGSANEAAALGGDPDRSGHREPGRDQPRRRNPGGRRLWVGLYVTSSLGEGKNTVKSHIWASLSSS